ncbi:MAG: GHKL domain-containing protein [Clostridia bacterium]|nr:GHKL domain-containing protein [Clostridia bacterium]
MQSIPLLIFMYFTEWLIVYTYIKEIYEKRNKLSMGFSILFYLILMVIYRYITNTEILNIVFTLICNILCIFCCFKSTFKSSIFHGIALCVAKYLSEYIAILIMSQVTSTPHNLYEENQLVYTVDLIICRLIYFSVCRLFLKFSNKEKPTAKWGKWALLAILPISSLFIIYVIRMLAKEQNFTQAENIVCIASLIMLLFANIVVYIIYERSEKGSQKLTELELANQKNEINMQYLQLLEAKNEKMNIMAHDYKNHLVAINDMCDSADVKNYINSMFDDISKYNRIAKTKNKFLDVILNKYIDMCETTEILFDVNVSTDNLDFMSNYDISSLFNNILDNAYEAALNSNEKSIYLEISRVLGSYHKIIAINSSDITPKTHNDNLLSTKTNKDSHGFGTKSIQKVVNKYQGELQWDYDSKKKEFKLVILFPDSNII